MYGLVCLRDLSRKRMRLGRRKRGSCWLCTTIFRVSKNDRQSTDYFDVPLVSRTSGSLPKRMFLYEKDLQVGIDEWKNTVLYYCAKRYTNKKDLKCEQRGIKRWPIRTLTRIRWLERVIDVRQRNRNTLNHPHSKVQKFKWNISEKTRPTIKIERHSKYASEIL